MEAGQSGRVAYWYGHLDQAAVSGLSLRDYAEQFGVKLHRLYSWSSRRKAVSPAPETAGRFARVEVAEPPRHRRPATQRLYLPSGAVLEWEGAADLALIDHLLGQ